MPGIGEVITESQIWKSIFRHPMPVDRRNRIVVMLTNFFLHLHPVSIKKQGIALSYTWCMGGVTFFLFLVETVTGVLLMFYYRPTLEWAYNDILALRDVYSLGIMREIHRWGAHAMVITVWLHMYRVFLTGIYKTPG
jgi:quinol-cytochrome oxidoreductase complex cytochrome b subunit